MMVWNKTQVLQIITVGLTILLVGCAGLFVAFDKKANRIQVLAAEEVTECSKVGNITVDTLGNFGKKVGRDKEKVAAELASKAIWEARDLNATAVVPITEIGRSGNQTFFAYVCS